MIRDFIKNKCGPNCPKVKEQLRAAIEKKPELLDGIFPRKKDADFPPPRDFVPWDERRVIEPAKVVEPKRPAEEDVGITDYERFIDEELQKSLPSAIAKEIPEIRREIPKDAIYEEVTCERPVRPPSEREVTTAVSVERLARMEKIVPIEPTRIISREPSEPPEDACDETCPWIIKQRGERLHQFRRCFQKETHQYYRHCRKDIMRRLKKRQRIIDHYYLTKGFNYFEDMCMCSLACFLYNLRKDQFVRSIFASLALFAVGMKLCSELDAWEMPRRIS